MWKSTVLLMSETQVLQSDRTQSVLLAIAIMVILSDHLSALI